MDKQQQASNTNISAILHALPLGTPSGVWASVSLPTPASADRSECVETGCIVTRADIVAAIESHPARTRISAAEVDAYTMAAGYALSILAARIIKATAHIAATSRSIEGAAPLVDAVDRVSSCLSAQEELTIAAGEAARSTGVILPAVIVGSRIMRAIVDASDDMGMVGQNIAGLAASLLIASHDADSQSEGES